VISRASSRFHNGVRISNEIDSTLRDSNHPRFAARRAPLTADLYTHSSKSCRSRSTRCRKSPLAGIAAIHPPAPSAVTDGDDPSPIGGSVDVLDQP